MCHLSLTPRTYWEVISDRQRTGPRESHPSEDLSELPPLRDPATRWFPNVMDYSDLKQGCGWTGVSLLDCRRGSGRTPVSPAAMRNSPPQAVLWTDGNRSAPYLAVFDAGASRTDGLGASSNVASASLSGASRQRTYPSCRIFYFQRSRGGRFDPLIMYRQ